MHLVENECIHMPQTEAHENHILKTAQRLEELNSWVSQGLDPWESFRIQAWYLPTEPELSEGISVYFTHSIHDNQYTYDALLCTYTGSRDPAITSDLSLLPTLLTTRPHICGFTILANRLIF